MKRKRPTAQHNHSIEFQNTCNKTDSVSFQTGEVTFKRSKIRMASHCPKQHWWKKWRKSFSFLLKENGFQLRILIYPNFNKVCKQNDHFLNIQDLKIYLSCTFLRGLLKEVFQQRNKVKKMKIVDSGNGQIV